MPRNIAVMSIGPGTIRDVVDAEDRGDLLAGDGRPDLRPRRRHVAGRPIADRRIRDHVVRPRNLLAVQVPDDDAVRGLESGIVGESSDWHAGAR